MENAYPDWTGFTPEKAAADLPRLLSEAERSVTALEASSPATFDELVYRLDDGQRELWRTWGMVGHLLGVMNSAEWRKLEAEWQPKLVAFSLRVGQSAAIYAAAKRLLATEADPVRRRILSKMVQAAEHAGIALAGARRERFNAIEARLSQLGSDFHNAVIDATRAFKFEKDGKTYTIDDANYPETMKHCADREVREKLYRARATRAPENAARIGEMLALRAESAALLGYGSYAELSLSSKCAPSVASVLKMVADLDEATVASAAAEEAELGPGLEPWDRAFAAERLRERKFAYSEDELKRHFELQDVLAGLFRMVNFLFGVEVEEVRSAAKPSVWHPDVRFFAVKESGRTVAHFYLDPYVRNGLKGGGAWMNEFRNLSVRPGREELPLATVVTNFPAPDADGRSHLPMREVETVFHEFGHALQCMLTRVGEEAAAGINLVEWDAVEVASQFMENWCLDDRTGIAVPAELKAKVRAAKNFRAATACRRQLAFAKLDMELHAAATPPDARATMLENFRHFGLPTIENDGFLNSFTHIFAGGYAAGYYGYKWSEVMSADCYGAFEEAGLDSAEAVRRTGRRYRDTVLALGGSKDALTVFREFRGRDPRVEALLRQQGLR